MFITNPNPAGEEREALRALLAAAFRYAAATRSDIVRCDLVKMLLGAGCNVASILADDLAKDGKKKVVWRPTTSLFFRFAVFVSWDQAVDFFLMQAEREKEEESDSEKDSPSRPCKT